MSEVRLIGEAPSYLGNDSKIVACRRIGDMEAKLEMLRSYGFSCEVERHAKHWLIHWKFPKLRLVSGYLSK